MLVSLLACFVLVGMMLIGMGGMEAFRLVVSIVIVEGVCFDIYN